MRFMMILKKLLKLGASVGFTFLIYGSLIDSFVSSDPLYAGLKPHYIVIFTLLFYAACTLTAFLFDKGYAVFAIISYLLTVVITAALGIAFSSVFVVALTQFWEYIVLVLAAAAMLWAPVFDVIRVILGYD